MTTLGDGRGIRGHGSVSWREKRNQWEIRIPNPRVKGGRESAFLPGTATEKQAHDKRIAMLAARDRGERRVGRRMTTAQWLDAWLELKAGRSLATRRAYESRIRTYLKPELGRIPLADLDEVDIARAMTRLAKRGGERTETLSTGTIDAAYRTLSAALEAAVKSKRIVANPALLVDVARPRSEILPPSQAEVDAILADVREHHPREYILFTMARWTGARKGELLGLRWADLHTAEGLVDIRHQLSGPLKTRSSQRRLLLAQPVVDVLEGYPRGLSGTLVFRTRTGLPLSERNITRIWDTAAERVGAVPPPESGWPRYRIHDLRHAFATMLLEAGAAPASVTAWLGHANGAQLDRYGHVRPIPGGDAYQRLTAAFGPEAHVIFGMVHLAVASRSRRTV